MARRNNGNDKILNSAALENILIGAYDAFVEENVEIRAEAGLTETITRESIGGCCEWCSKLAGTYRYGEEPKEVYQKHDNCTCVVTAKTDKGYTDVWSKKQYQSQKEAMDLKEPKNGFKTYIEADTEHYREFFKSNKAIVKAVSIPE